MGSIGGFLLWRRQAPKTLYWTRESPSTSGRTWTQVTKDSQLMRNSDTASDQWSMSGLTTHCPSQARAKTDNSDGKMTQKLSWTVQIKTDSKIVLKFPRSLLPHNYHATQLLARCTSTKKGTGSRKQFQARGFSAWWQIKILVVSGYPSGNLSG